jgi:uncharacterized membrane protein YuzA (DUF378 family)
MMTSRTPAMRLVAALLTGLVGFFAFNVIDGVFGFVESLIGLVASIAATVVVVWRSPLPQEESDA